MKDYRITVRFPAELRRRLSNAARRSGTRESEIVRAAIERQLAIDDQQLTAYERAKEAGLIGAVRGTARDLSTNSRPYFKAGNSLVDLTTRHSHSAL